MRLNSVAVIGAGVAGAAVAHALARHGATVTVLDAAQPGSGASGNPLAVFRPLLARAATPALRLTQAAFLHDLHTWGALEGVVWARCGVLHLARDAADAAKQAQALAFMQPAADFAVAVDRARATAIAGWSLDAGGVFFPQAGWVQPASLLRGWLAGVTVRTGARVTRLSYPAGTRWQVFGPDDALLAEADAVVVANAYEATQLLPDAPWTLTRVRGQVTWLAGELPPIRTVVAREGYVAPLDGGLIVGATYEHTSFDTRPDAASDASNLARLAGLLPGAAVSAQQVCGQRAALRATLPDRLPVLGPVPGQAGLYVASGYASRGVVWAGLLGETLAALMLGTPPPLEPDLLAAIAPARFSARRARR